MNADPKPLGETIGGLIILFCPSVTVRFFARKKPDAGASPDWVRFARWAAMPYRIAIAAQNQ